MQVNVICPSAQAGVWKAVPEVTHVLPHDSLNQLREALAADEFYNDGPLDLGVMLDQDMETLKALEPYGPMMFSGLDTHPGARKYKFRVKAPVLRAAPPMHRVQLYLQLGGCTAGCLESVPVPGEKGGAAETPPSCWLRSPAWAAPVNGVRNNGRSWFPFCRAGPYWPLWKKTGNARPLWRNA